MEQRGLFSPALISVVPVANRIAMASLTRSDARMNGVQLALAVEYYR